jgi:hypothetical protein
MFCPNCGNKFEENDMFCTSCGMRKGTHVPALNEGENNQSINTPPVVNSLTEAKDNRNAGVLCIISLACFFGMPVISVLLNILLKEYYITYELSGLGTIAGIVLMIVARTKYPQNTFAKVVMYIYIVLFILSIIGIIYVAVLLLWACYGCSHMGSIG